jgi:hypothetical protein
MNGLDGRAETRSTPQRDPVRPLLNALHKSLRYQRFKLSMHNRESNVDSPGGLLYYQNRYVSFSSHARPVLYLLLYVYVYWRGRLAELRIL